MRQLVYIISILIGYSWHSIAQQYNYATDPLFELVLADEFDSLGLNTDKWYGYWGGGPNLFNTNKKKGCNAPAFLPDSTVDVAYCDRDLSGPTTNNRSFDTTGTGFMRIINKREFRNGDIYVYVNGNFDHGVTVPFKFTTSVAVSKLKIKYGYFEIRWRMNNIPTFDPLTYPNGLSNAYGPNFWMLGGDANCIYSELDIFEQRGTDWALGPNIHMQVDSTAPFYNASSGATPGTPAAVYGNLALNGPYNGGAWHTAGCEWNDQVTEFYYDHVTSPTSFKQADIPLNQMTQMSLIIDCYVPALQYCVQWDSLKTQMPFNYDIDYVKVYQQKQDCSSKTFNNTGNSIYQSKVYKDVSITGTSAFTGGVSHICGQDFVLLNAGFEIGSAAEVTIDNRNCLPDQAANATLSTDFPNIIPPSYFKTKVNEVKSLPRSN